MGRSLRPTARGATLSVSFLTCIKLRFLLPVLKFKIFYPRLQGSFVGISHCNLIVLKNQQRQVLNSLSWKFKQKHEGSIIFYPVHFIENKLRRLSACHKLQTSNHPHNFFHKIIPNLKHRFTSSQITQQLKNAPKPRVQHDHARISNQVIQCSKFQQEQIRTKWQGKTPFISR